MWKLWCCTGIFMNFRKLQISLFWGILQSICHSSTSLVYFIVVTYWLNINCYYALSYMVYIKFLVVFEFQDISLIIIWEWISEAGLGRRNHQKKQQQQQQQRLILYPARMPIKQTRFVSVMLNISCSTIVSQAVTEFSFHKLCFCYLFFICLLMSNILFNVFLYIFKVLLTASQTNFH